MMLPTWRIAHYVALDYNLRDGFIFIAPEQTRKPPALSANVSGGGAWIEHLAQQAVREMTSRTSLPAATPFDIRLDATARFVELACGIVPGLAGPRDAFYDSPALREHQARMNNYLLWEIIAVPEQAAAHVCRVLSEQGDTSDDYCYRAAVPHDLWDYTRAIRFCSDVPRRVDVQALITGALTLADTASHILCERLRRDGISKIDARGWVGENFDEGFRPLSVLSALSWRYFISSSSLECEV